MFSGIILILGSQIVSASQMVIEEAFLKKRNLHPLHVSLVVHLKLYWNVSLTSGHFWEELLTGQTFYATTQIG